MGNWTNRYHGDEIHVEQLHSPSTPRTLLVGAFVERDDYSSGFLETDRFLSFLSCNVYRI